MKILLDECLPVDFRHSFPAAELAGYDVLLTVDQGIAYQQNLTGNRLSIISIRSKTNQLEDLRPLVGAILEALKTIGLG
jgi:hypothetical protein